MNTAILKFLKANGEQLDSEISQALDIPLAQLKTQVAELSASGDVICCHVPRFIEGKKIEGTSCRLSCDLPAPARGRKPGVKKDADLDKFPE
ncbi:MAG: transcriptional regulator [Propionivibrio sp.]